MERSRSPDEYYARPGRWHVELLKVRAILQTTGLSEEIKWGAPCYTLNGENIVGVAAFKAHFALWFHQGALLKDDKGVLINAQEGVTKAQRQWRMFSASEIKPTLIKAYVREAIANASAGKSIKPDRAGPLSITRELKAALRADAGLGAAFKALTPGRQREYADYVSEAKQEATRQRRIEKITPMIKAGGGLNDKYKPSRS